MCLCNIFQKIFALLGVMLSIQTTKQQYPLQYAAVAPLNTFSKSHFPSSSSSWFNRQIGFKFPENHHMLTHAFITLIKCWNMIEIDEMNVYKIGYLVKFMENAFVISSSCFGVLWSPVASSFEKHSNPIWILWKLNHKKAFQSPSIDLETDLAWQAKVPTHRW